MNNNESNESINYWLAVLSLLVFFAMEKIYLQILTLEIIIKLMLIMYLILGMNSDITTSESNGVLLPERS